MDKKIIFLLIVLGIVLSGCQITEEQTEEPVETGEEELNETIEPEEETEDINDTESEENVFTIEIDNLTLSQKYVTIEKGTTVVWTNKESRPHMLAAHYGEFRSSRLEQGDSFSHTFNEVGEYTYICAIFKKNIAGTINVEENP